jgi:hypothetical protein
MDEGDRRYLTSLVRMDIRKKERGLEKFAARPGQTAREAADTKEQLECNLAFRRSVLERLRK